MNTKRKSKNLFASLLNQKMILKHLSPNSLTNKIDNTDTYVYGNQNLPLYGFFLSLKQNGFLVTLQQIAECHKVIAQFSDKVESEHDLCNYLVPHIRKK